MCVRGGEFYPRWDEKARCDGAKNVRKQTKLSINLKNKNYVRN